MRYLFQCAFEATCDGEYVAQVRNARALLKDSKAGVNPFTGWKPSVPNGVRLEPGSPEYYELEQLGVSQLRYCGFVLVAGGLGERLGFTGIKISLPTENIVRKSYIKLYCEYILAMQAKHKDIKLPLAIMLSDDTEAATKLLFAESSNFGLSSDQLYFMKQEDVAALIDNDARLARSDDSRYRIAMKPHGHGDVHSLLYSSGVAAKWESQGIKWCYFFQDTNALVFMSLPAMIGVSVQHEFDMNSMTVPRRAKQAVGGIVRLVGDEGEDESRTMTINVEYNQLDPLLRSNGYPDGDVNDPATGLSPYPGNINELLFHLPSYLRVLRCTHGVVGEFVNPKYTDDTRENFKKPTRLECMMQDYPKAKEVDPDRVGFTQAPAWFCYTPVKNSRSAAEALAASGIPAACPMSGESDLYGVTRRLLCDFGCNVDEDVPLTIGGITAPLGPRLLCSPSFAMTVSDLREAFPSPAFVHITARSTLYLSGNIVVERLSLNGSLLIENNDPEVRLLVRIAVGATVTNKGHQVAVLNEGTKGSDMQDRESETRNMFGYDILEEESKKVLIIAGELTPGVYVFNGVDVVPC